MGCDVCPGQITIWLTGPKVMGLGAGAISIRRVALLVPPAGVPIYIVSVTVNNPEVV